MNSWFRGWIQGKTRIALAWGFAGLLIFFARDFPKWHGVILCFTGAVLRFWASGYLRKDRRPAVGGPYAFVRNPLYLGTYLMAVGVALSIENWILLASVTVFFALIYHFIILDEETKLRKIFGAPYLTYCSTVPRFFPRPWPAARRTLMKINPEQEHLQYSMEIAMKNKAYEAFVSFIGLVGLVMMAAYAWKAIR